MSDQTPPLPPVPPLPPLPPLPQEFAQPAADAPTEVYPAYSAPTEAYAPAATAAYPSAYPPAPSYPASAPAYAPASPAYAAGAPAAAYGHAAPYAAPAYPQYANAVPLQPTKPAGPSTLGMVALIAAIVAAVVSTVLSSIGIFNAAAGAMAQAAGLTPEDLDQLQPEGFLAFLSPVRGWVLMTEIGFWLGLVFGIWALVQGIIAIVKKRGRVLGIVAVVVGALAPVIYGTVVYIVFFAGIAAGFAGSDLPAQP